MKIIITDRTGQILYEGSPDLHGNGIKVGTATDCDIQLNKMGIAHHHLQIRYNTDGYLTLQDLQSPFGTIVNNEKVQPGFITTISPGAFIELTDNVFMRLQLEAEDKKKPAAANQIFPFFLNSSESFVRKSFANMRSKMPRQYYSVLSASEGELVTRMKELSAIVEVSYALNSIKSFPQLLEFTLEMALAVTGGERAIIMLYNEELGRLETVAMSNFKNSEVKADMDAVSPLVSECFDKGKVFVGPVPNFKAFFKRGRMPEDVGISSVAVVPMKEGTAHIGVLYVDTKHVNDVMTSRTDNLLNVFAAQASVAISQTRMFYAATADTVTGISNQNLFLRRLGEEFCRAQRHQIDISLIIMDIDHFSVINKTYGETTGNKVLKEVGRIFTATTRIHDLVARIGSDTFAMLLPQTPQAGAQVVAQKLKSTLGSMKIRASNRTIQITGSFGIASSSKAMSKPADLLKNAEKMLKQAQKRGGNQIS